MRALWKNLVDDGNLLEDSLQDIVVQRLLNCQDIGKGGAVVFIKVFYTAGGLFQECWAPGSFYKGHSVRNG